MIICPPNDDYGDTGITPAPPLPWTTFLSTRAPTRADCSPAIPASKTMVYYETSVGGFTDRHDNWIQSVYLGTEYHKSRTTRTVTYIFLYLFLYLPVSGTKGFLNILLISNYWIRYTYLSFYLPFILSHLF